MLGSILGVISTVIRGVISVIMLVPFGGQVDIIFWYHFEGYVGVIVGALLARRPTKTLLKTRYLRENIRNT